MTERLFPLQPVSDQDPRFTFGLLMDVADVLEDHDYPSIRETASGADLVALRQALFGFLYGDTARVEDSRSCARYACPTPDVCGFCHGLNEHAESTSDEMPHTVPCIWGCGYLAESEADLNDHELSCPADRDVVEAIEVDPVSWSVRTLRRGGGRRLCAHADDNEQGMHWLNPGEHCPADPSRSDRDRGSAGEQR